MGLHVSVVVCVVTLLIKAICMSITWKAYRKNTDAVTQHKPIVSGTSESSLSIFIFRLLFDKSHIQLWLRATDPAFGRLLSSSLFFNLFDSVLRHSATIRMCGPTNQQQNREKRKKLEQVAYLLFCSILAVGRAHCTC